MSAQAFDSGGQAFPRSDGAFRVAGEVIDASKGFEALQQMNEWKRDSYNSYGSQLSGNPANSAKIIKFPSGEAKGIKDQK